KDGTFPDALELLFIGKLQEVVLRTSDVLVPDSLEHKLGSFALGVRWFVRERTERDDVRELGLGGAAESDVIVRREDLDAGAIALERSQGVLQPHAELTQKIGVLELIWGLVLG